MLIRFEGSAGATSGKCGFGGSSDDNNGVTTARGGLNKDQDNPSYSPHHHLHYNAYSAANEATFQFFIDPGDPLNYDQRFFSIVFKRSIHR